MSPSIVECQETTIRALAETDAWIGENTTSNTGSDAILNVDANPSSGNSRALVRFALPGGAPEGCVVESAMLRLFSPEVSESFKVEVVRLGSGWSEGLVLWSNQPGMVGSVSSAWSREGYMQWRVASQVQAMLEGENHGFLVRDSAEGTIEGGGGHGFYSREKGENPPELVIRFAAPSSGEPPGPPEPPAPAPVSCGQVLTRSTQVTNNLAECPGDGLVIGADRIIVDLDGHTIDGVGLGTGIFNDAYASVTVKNGTVQQFDYGVELLPETKLNLVEGLTLRLNELAGIELFDAEGNEIRANTVTSNGDGIALVSGTRGSVVVDNRMTLNSGAGVLFVDSNANRLERNSVSGGGDLGIGLERASGNTLLGNTVSGNSDGGIEIRHGSNTNRVESNDVSESGDTGIMVDESDRNELISNTTRLLSDSGITLNSANDGIVRDNDLRFSPGGLQVDGSSRNLIESNNASNTSGIGIELGGGSYDNTVALNTANTSDATGIYIADEALTEPGNLLYGNTASGNRADGIVVAKGGHAITANVTRNNGGWGINAIGENIDGLGNVATGNGKVEQCSGVVCKAEWIPPDTTIDAGPDDPTNSTSASFGFGGSDDTTPPSALRFECRLDSEDDADFVACSSPRSYMGLDPGSHTFEVRAIDRAQNVDPTPATYTWTVGTTPPETTIDSGPDAITNSAVATFAFSSGEPGSTFECSLDSAPFAPCTSPAEYSGLADGAHRFEVRATDQAGNVDAEPAIHSWTVDTTPPHTTIESGPIAHTNDTSASFSLAADEQGSTFECSLDGAVAEPCVSPAEYSGLADGAHEFQVRATDRAGNLEPEPAIYAWTVDTTPPETTIEVGPADPTNETSASFRFRADEEGVSFACSLDGGAFVGCSSPADYTGLGTGAHSFRVRATDRAGNLDPTSAVHTWTVDTVAPETTIDSGPADPSPERTAEFEFSSSEAGSSFECQLDAGAWVSCSSPQAHSDLADGAHSFLVRATDRAGNLDPDPAIYGWTIEEPNVMPPDTTITSAPPALTASTSASFAFSSSETGSTFECSLDDAAFTACSSPLTYSGLAAGAHSFLVRAIDAVGNMDASPAVHSWTVDKLAPETTITAAPPALTATTSASFAFSSSETGSTFECSLDDAAFTACGSPHHYTGLSNGGHDFRVRAKDPAGNTDPSPASYAWTVDSTPPETSINSGPPASTTSTSATFTFSASEPGSTFECSFDGAAFSVCVSPREYTGLAAGAHEFRSRAKDAAGNVDASPASYSWTIQAPAGCAGSSTVTAGANADSWVLQSSSSSNYGHDSVVKVDTKSGANARALFRFALPAIPAGCEVTDARLRLYASSYKSGRTLRALRLGANWTESGVTWSNQPLTSGAAATAASPSVASYVQWSVTSQVQSMYSSGNHGFLIRDSVENGNGIEQGFHSREKAPDNPPQLVVSFGSIVTGNKSHSNATMRRRLRSQAGSAQMKTVSHR